MLLNQLVKINEKGLVANAVDFNLMDDLDKNLSLCRGFVFNYDPDPNRIRSSTVGVLDAIWRSFHSPNEPNIHLMVQDYGKGKSHFALAVANFFNKDYNSPEVQGILQQVEYATSSTSSILDSLKLYKQRSRHLVICLSGEKFIDLKKHFLQALIKTLDAEGITDSIAQQICKRPLKYLRNMDVEHREAAEAFLQRQKDQDADLNMLIQLLENNNYHVIPQVKDIFRELIGVPPDFDADVDVEAILSDLINHLCKGVNPRFQGILILFDELYNYLQVWANDPVQAGSTTLQNITNVCERFKGHIALVSFTQRRPNSVTPAKHFEDYKRLVSRLELLPSLYEPAASLELVLNGLLNQQEKTAAWQEFRSKWRDTLTDINTNIYQKRTANYYQSRNWTLDKFQNSITLGCFPLHPLTSYLLCNLDFTQGRTAIQFVQKDVKEFILEQPVEENGSLNLICPVALVDAFADNFATSDYSAYSAYRHAHDSIVASADPEELIILKALFLFYASASANKLTKQDWEKHEEILSLLAGMFKAKVKVTLDKLSNVREVIHLNHADNTYRFYLGGFGIQDLRKRVEEEVANLSPSIEKVREYCQLNLRLYAGDTVSPRDFIEQNRLMSSDWLFRCEVQTAAGFRKALNSQQPLKDEKGLVVYVVAETGEELVALKSEISQLLTPSDDDSTFMKRRTAVAIASQPAADIARLLLMLENVKRKSVEEFGAALTQLQQQFQQQVDSKIKEMFNSCIYHCHVLERVPISDRSSPFRVTSAILEDLYHCAPPIEKIEKMARGSTVGSEVIAYVSRELLDKGWCTQAFHKQSYGNVVKPVFATSWGLLKPSSQQYLVAEPTQRNIKAAWDRISEITALNEKTEKVVEIASIWETLSSPPYGYNEYTFTILFTGWLAYHRAEVSLRGSFGMPEREPRQVSIRTEPIKAWATTGILNKPKDFIYKWVLSKAKPQLIRRKPLPYPQVPNAVNHEQARQFIQEIDSFLASTPDSTQVSELTNTRHCLTAGTEQIDELSEPVFQAENLLKSVKLSDIELLVRIHSQLQQPLSAISEGGISISPTEQQQRQRSQVLQAVLENIGQVVEVESERFHALHTAADCSAYKANIQRIQVQLSQSNLPSRFSTSLQDALRAADIRLGEILEQEKVENCLLQIQSLYKSLGDQATQYNYIHVQTEIEKLVESVPAARDTEIYTRIVQSLAKEQDALIQQIVDWEHQCSSIKSCDQAMQLSQSINRQLYRFTEDSQKRLHELLQHLNKIILERESEEQKEKNKGAARLWLANLEKQYMHLTTNSIQKLETANQLLKEIKKGENQYEEILEVEQNLTLKRIVNHCLEIQNQDLESRILTLFQELPSDKRESLLKKLADYVLRPTEDFNG